jgi:uncharacterized OsmC-like protein
VDTETLRAAQAPLKAKYREDPSAALITLHAEGELGAEDVACNVATSRAMVEAGLHPATGGTGALACSGDMLLQALVACAGVTLQAVATNRGLKVAGTVRAEGDLDFKGTLGTDRDSAVGFTAIRLSFDLQTDVNADDLDALIETTRRYCVVYQTLANSPDLSITAS